jgi:multiple sugar transport system ATP-binding protein
LHARLGSTMIFVTHDQVEAMTLADRIVIMHNRKIEQVGTPMEIYRRPASRFVAGFVGSPAMNFVPLKSANRQWQHPDDWDQRPWRYHAAFRLPVELFAGWSQPRHPRRRCCCAAGGQKGIALTAEVVERLGDRTLIYGHLADGTKLTAETDGRSEARGGDTLQIALDTTAIHLFDAAGIAHHSEGE